MPCVLHLHPGRTQHRPPSNKRLAQASHAPTSCNTTERPTQHAGDEGERAALLRAQLCGKTGGPQVGPHPCRHGIHEHLWGGLADGAPRRHACWGGNTSSRLWLRRQRALLCLLGQAWEVPPPSEHLEAGTGWQQASRGMRCLAAVFSLLLTPKNYYSACTNWRGLAGCRPALAALPPTSSPGAPC